MLILQSRVIYSVVYGTSDVNFLDLISYGYFLVIFPENFRHSKCNLSILQVHSGFPLPNLLVYIAKYVLKYFNLK